MVMLGGTDYAELPMTRAPRAFADTSALVKDYRTVPRAKVRSPSRSGVHGNGTRPNIADIAAPFKGAG